MTGSIRRIAVTALMAFVLLPSAAVAQQNVNAWVTSNFIAVLGRNPDPGGWMFWGSSMQQGVTQSQLTNYFLTSGEYASKYGSPDNTTFVTILIQNAYGRAPADGEVKWWLGPGGLSNGSVTRAQVVHSFITSQEFQTDHGAYVSTYCAGSASPLAFATAPSVATTVEQAFTVTHANACGTSDIASGQVLINAHQQDGASTTGACYVEWDHSGNVVLQDPNANPSQGVMGSAVVLQGSACSVNLQNSHLNTAVATNPKAVAATLALTFPATFAGTHEVYAWGTDAETVATPSLDLGALAVSQGQDFTLNVSPASPPSVPLWGTQTFTITSAGVNGFNGNIALSVDTAITDPYNRPYYNSCLSYGGGFTPSTIGANGQATITVTNVCTNPYYNQYYLPIRGLASSISSQHTTLAAGIVSVPGPTQDFAITATVAPSSAATLASDHNITYSIAATPVSGLSGTVNLSVTGLPPNVGYAPPQPVTIGGAPAALTLYSMGNLTGGTYALTVSGQLVGSSTTRYATISLPVQGPALTIGSTPVIPNNNQQVAASFTVSGASAAYQTCSAAGSGVNCAVSNPTTTTAPLNLTAVRGPSLTAAHGSRIVSLTSGGGSPTAQANMQVSDSPPTPTGVTTSPANPVCCGPVTLTITGHNFSSSSCPATGVVRVLQNSQEVGWAYTSTVVSDGEIDMQVTPDEGSSGTVSLLVDLCGCYWFGCPDMGPMWACLGPITVAFVLAAEPEPTLSCTPSTVTRGQAVTCTVSGTDAGNVSSWQFSGGGAAVQGQSGVLTWSGTMVVSGTVTATVTGAGALQQNITVNARNWHTQPAQAAMVDNGQLVVRGTVRTLPVPPAPGNDSGMGVSGWQESWSGENATVINSGPNTGFAFFAFNVTFTTFFFKYTINPDLLNQGSVFSQHQCGTAGWISWSNLLAQTTRHEAGQSQSHYSNYSAAMNSSDNNFGDYLEHAIATPGSDLQQFVAGVGNWFTTAASNIDAAGAAENIPPVNADASGNFLGNINYGPNYAQCN